MGILAIILGAIGLGRAQYVGTGQGMAITGLVLGILTAIWKLIQGLPSFSPELDGIRRLRIFIREATH